MKSPSSLKTTGTAIISRTVLECIHSWSLNIEPEEVSTVLGTKLHAVMQSYRQLRSKGEAGSNRFKVTMTCDNKIKILPGGIPSNSEVNGADYIDNAGQAFINAEFRTS